jgi:hypothetical protein
MSKKKAAKLPHEIVKKGQSNNGYENILAWFAVKTSK